MGTHSGHPAIVGTDTASASRAKLADALDFVSTQTITATATINPDNGRTVLIDATAGVITVTLPDPASDERHGRVRMVLKKTDSSGNAVTIAASGSGRIDGLTTKTLAAQWDTLVVFNDSVTEVWYVESSL